MVHQRGRLGHTVCMRPHLLFHLVLLAAVSTLLGAPPAGAQTTTGSVIEEAAEAVASDPVYVDPAAKPGLSEQEADELRSRIAQLETGPIYIAVLGEEALNEAGSASEVLQTFGESVGAQGTYAVVVGEELEAGATDGTAFEPGTVPALADEAEQANGDKGPGAVLLSFVGGLSEAAAQGEAGETGESGDSGGGLPGFGLLLPLLLVLGIAGLVVSGIRRRRREQAEAEKQLEAVREVAMDDLVALGEDLRGLDLEVEMPGADPEAKNDYVRALESYERASADLDRARRLEDLRPVTSALEEGRFAMASAKARLEGREPPERRPPCFFDPRHGPSVEDVEWAPPGGQLRPVPACAADARRIERGDDPEAREVSVDGEMVAYWNAPNYYGPWAGGYFGGGMLEGLLIGSMLGGGLGFGHDHGDSGFDQSGFGGDSGGGDSGGGDFGGGDFG